MAKRSVGEKYFPSPPVSLGASVISATPEEWTVLVKKRPSHEILYVLMLRSIPISGQNRSKTSTIAAGQVLMFFKKKQPASEPRASTLHERILTAEGRRRKLKAAQQAPKKKSGPGKS
jgi:hypothetical protein